jgi:hypothetical protein
MYELFYLVHSSIGNNIRTMLASCTPPSSTTAVSGVFSLPDFHPAWLLAMSTSPCPPFFGGETFSIQCHGSIPGTSAQ